MALRTTRRENRKGDEQRKRKGILISIDEPSQTRTLPHGRSERAFGQGQANVCSLSVARLLYGPEHSVENAVPNSIVVSNRLVTRWSALNKSKFRADTQLMPCYAMHIHIHSGSPRHAIRKSSAAPSLEVE